MQVAAAPTVVSESDLLDMLVPPPSADWIESTTSEDVIVGPFDAHSYAQSLTEQSTDSWARAEARLKQLGLVEGYGRAWQKAGSKDDLSEVVFRFNSASGANAWLQLIRGQDERSSSYRGALTGAESIPDAFSGSFGFSSYQLSFVYFPAGKLLFSVGMGSYRSDLAAAAVAQAQAQYRLAVPSKATPKGAKLNAATAEVPWLWPLVPLAGAVVTILVLAVSGIILVAARRSGHQPTQRTVLSPDGNYWWDGLEWRPTRPGSE